MKYTEDALVEAVARKEIPDPQVLEYDKRMLRGLYFVAT